MQCSTIVKRGRTTLYAVNNEVYFDPKNTSSKFNFLNRYKRTALYALQE